jgi:hypothetical protein
MHFLKPMEKLDMNILKDTTTGHGINQNQAVTIGEKVAAWGIVLMIFWLIWNQ